MKKNKIITLTAYALLSVSLLSTTVYAQAPTLYSSALISTQAEETLVQNKLVSGTVSDVKLQDGTYTITIKNEDMGMVFTVNPSVFILDQKTKKYAQIEEIHVGSKITAILNKNAPMTLSLPPITNGAVGFLLNSDAGFSDLSIYNEALINKENTLALNSSESTLIFSENGAKRRYTADDLKNKECLVLYTASTRSIPAQTTPELVMILNGQREIDTKDTYVSLRSYAEEKGYTVIWSSKDAPVSLKKGDVRFSLSIGTTSFTFTSEKETKTQEMTSAPKLENGITLVPQSFLDLL